MPTVRDQIDDWLSSGLTKPEVQKQLRDFYGAEPKALKPHLDSDVEQVRKALRPKLLGGDVRNAQRPIPPDEFDPSYGVSADPQTTTDKRVAMLRRGAEALYKLPPLGVQKAPEPEPDQPTMEEQGAAQGSEAQDAIRGQNKNVTGTRFVWSPGTNLVAGSKGIADAVMNAKEEIAKGSDAMRERHQTDIATKHPFVRGLESAYGVVSMLPNLAADVALPHTVPGDASDEAARSMAFAQSYEKGRDVARGLMGGVTQQVAHPWESAQADPFGMAAVAVPALLGGLKLFKATPEGAKFAGRVGQAADAVARRTRAADARTWAKTIWNESTYHPDPRVRAAMDVLFHEPNITKSGIEQAGEHAGQVAAAMPELKASGKRPVVPHQAKDLPVQTRTTAVLDNLLASTEQRSVDNPAQQQHILDIEQAYKDLPPEHRADLDTAIEELQRRAAETDLRDPDAEQHKEHVRSEKARVKAQELSDVAAQKAAAAEQAWRKIPLTQEASAEAKQAAIDARKEHVQARMEADRALRESHLVPKRELKAKAKADAAWQTAVENWQKLKGARTAADRAAETATDAATEKQIERLKREADLAKRREERAHQDVATKSKVAAKAAERPDALAARANEKMAQAELVPDQLEADRLSSLVEVARRKADVADAHLRTVTERHRKAEAKAPKDQQDWQNPHTLAQEKAKAAVELRKTNVESAQQRLERHSELYKNKEQKKIGEWEAADRKLQDAIRKFEEHKKRRVESETAAEKAAWDAVVAAEKAAKGVQLEPLAPKQVPETKAMQRAAERAETLRRNVLDTEQRVAQAATEREQTAAAAKQAWEAALTARQEAAAIHKEAAKAGPQAERAKAMAQKAAEKARLAREHAENLQTDADAAKLVADQDRWGSPAAQRAIAYKVKSILDAESPQYLRDRGVREEVVKRVVDRIWGEEGDRAKREGSRVATERVVKNAIDEHILQENNPVFVRETQGLETLPDTIAEVNKVTAEVVRELHPEALAKARETALAEFGHEMARMGRKIHRRNALLAERNRFGSHPLMDPQAAEIAAQEAKSVAELRKASSAEVLGASPKELHGAGTPETSSVNAAYRMVQHLRETPDAPPPMLLDTNPHEVAKVLQKWAVEDRFGDIAPRDLFDLAHDLKTWEPLEQLKHGIGGFGAPFMKQQLELQHAAEANMSAMLHSHAYAALRNVKGRLTYGNLPSVLNNYASNVAEQIVRTGDPTIMVKIPATWRTFGQWARNGHATAVDARAFANLGETNLLNSDYTREGLGPRGTTLPEKIGNLPGIKQATDVARTVDTAEQGLYRLGDNAPKLQEYVTNFRTLAKATSWLEPDGAPMTVQTSPRTKVTIQRTSKGWETRTSGGKIEVLDNSPASAKVIDRILAKAAAKPAQDLFFDYGDTSALAKVIQKSHQFAITSSFFTWASKAVDIPFVQKGLVARSMLPPGVVIESANPKILAQQVSTALGAAARRSLVINGLRQEFDDSRKLRTAFRFSPADDRLQVLRVTSDPTFIEQANFGGWNYAGPSLSIFRAAAEALVKGAQFATGDKSTDAIDERLRPAALAKAKRWHNLLGMVDRGELSKPSDVLDFIGLSGGPIADTWKKVMEADEAGKTFGKQEVWNLMGAAMLGGNVKTAIDVALSAPTAGNEPAALLAGTPYARSLTVANVPRDFLTWMVLKTTGLGWRFSPMDRGLKNLSKLKTEWNKSLNIPTREERALAAFNAANEDSPEYEAAKAELTQIAEQKQAIDHGMALVKLNWMQTFKQLTGKAPDWQDEVEETAETPQNTDDRDGGK